jgi:LacI family transcriptional regulator
VTNLKLEDIARQAGVSRSTVSRVVNDDPHVRDDVRERVKDVIRRTGFHPNAAARTLASSRSSMIGLVLPRSVSSFFTDPYFPRLTQGIAQGCNQNQYTLGLFLVGSKEDEEAIFPRISRRGLLDGVIFQSGELGDQLVDRLVASNMPLLVLGRPFSTEGISYIDVDNVGAVYQAVTHLIQLGYRRIGTIAGPGDTTVGIDRLEGYRRALADRGREIENALIVETDFSEMSGYYAMQGLLRTKPDAVFAASDALAIGGIRAVREAGLRVPEDVAFVGFDDLPIATSTDCPLTTVRQPVAELGLHAVETLLELAGSESHTPRRIMLDTQLIIRDSCGAKLKRQG